MPPRFVGPGRQWSTHRHAADLTAQGVAAWLGCPRCQRGHPVLISAAGATAIATILAAITGGQPPLEGGDHDV